jgi:hypothetical protein
MTASPSADAAALEDFRSIQQWRQSFARFWRGGEPEQAAFEALARFVAVNEVTPDEIIDQVLRSKESGDLMLRTRARRKWMGLIQEFEDAEQSRDAANGVRSFMIHNGVAMNPPILR